MKRLFILPCLLVISAAALAQSTGSLSFTINGAVEDVQQPAKIIFQYPGEAGRVSDTVELVRGKFQLSGTIVKPVQGTISILKSGDNPRMMLSMDYDGSVTGRDGLEVYLDRGDISIKGKTLNTAIVSGSAAHRDYMILKKMLRPVYDKLKAISAEMVKLSPEEREGEANKKLMSSIMQAFKEMKPIEDAFIKSHLNSYVSWNMVANKSIIDDPAKHKDLYDLFSEKFRNTAEGEKVLKKIHTAFITAIGQAAPQFTQNNTEGKPISLASLKGRYVLVDFWASWCGPCRAENPNVVKAYNRFKNKNFEILAVSLDNKKEPWLQAIEKDGLPWLHVSDLKGWKNDVAVLYNVQAVPQNWLIDPNGVIVAKNMRGEELEKKLSELVK